MAARISSLLPVTLVTLLLSLTVSGCSSRDSGGEPGASTGGAGDANVRRRQRGRRRRKRRRRVWHRRNDEHEHRRRIERRDVERRVAERKWRYVERRYVAERGGAAQSGGASSSGGASPSGGAANGGTSNGSGGKSNRRRRVEQWRYIERKRWCVGRRRRGDEASCKRGIVANTAPGAAFSACDRLVVQLVDEDVGGQGTGIEFTPMIWGTSDLNDCRPFRLEVPAYLQRVQLSTRQVEHHERSEAANDWPR